MFKDFNIKQNLNTFSQEFDVLANTVKSAIKSHLQEHQKLAA